MKQKLTPPDKKRCQAYRHNGANAFTLGGKPEYIQCSNKPVVIVKEKTPGEDGQKGSMSLCEQCLKVFNENDSKKYSFTKITETTKTKEIKRFRVIDQTTQEVVAKFDTLKQVAKYLKTLDYYVYNVECVKDDIVIPAVDLIEAWEEGERPEDLQMF